MKAWDFILGLVFNTLGLLFSLFSSRVGFLEKTGIPVSVKPQALLAVNLIPIISALIGFILFRTIARSFKINTLKRVERLSWPWKTGWVLAFLFTWVAFSTLWCTQLASRGLTQYPWYWLLIYAAGFVLALLLTGPFYWIVSKVFQMIPGLSPGPVYDFLKEMKFGKALIPFKIRRH